MVVVVGAGADDVVLGSVVVVVVVVAPVVDGSAVDDDVVDTSVVVDDVGSTDDEEEDEDDEEDDPSHNGLASTENTVSLPKPRFTAHFWDDGRSSGEASTVTLNVAFPPTGTRRYGGSKTIDTPGHAPTTGRTITGTFAKAAWSLIGRWSTRDGTVVRASTPLLSAGPGVWVDSTAVGATSGSTPF